MILPRHVLSPLTVIHRLLQRRKNLTVLATGFIAAHGDTAWMKARSQAIRAQTSASWALVREIERQLHMPPRLDTATRYLNSN